MQSGKKITKEDTWRPDDLKRYIRVEENSDDYVRRQDVTERRHRGGESRDRQHRDPEKESRKERDKHREQGSTRDRHAEDKDKSVEYRKEGSSDRRGNREQHGRDEKDKERRRDKERPVDVVEHSEDYRETRNRRRDKEEKHDRERDKERQRDKEKERLRDNEVVMDKRKEEREKERRREEREREHRSERRRLEKSGEEERKKKEKKEIYDGVRKDGHRERDRHRSEYEEKTNDKETRERHGDRKHSGQLGEREYKEEHRKHNEERERRHKERGHYEVERKHGSKSSEHRESKRSVEEVGHHRGDREQAEIDKHRERRHREEEEPQRKDRDRRHKEEEEPQRKHRDRRHRQEEVPERKHREEAEPERKHRDRRHREEEEPERKHRERRHNVEEMEPEGNHTDKTSSKTTSSSHKNETNAEETKVALDEDYGDQEYEDDFEDYEEDFEEMDESENEDGDARETVYSQVEEREELTPQRQKEIEAIQRAMEEENERAGTAQSRHSTSKEEEDRAKCSKAPEKDQSEDSQRGKFIDFMAAKQREVSKKVATKQKKRSKELLRLIDLDFSMTFSLLDLPPVNEYDMYIRNFGSANTKQAYVQCNEDNADRDIQTEEIEMSEKWTQHPPECNGACGDPNLSQEAKDKIRSELTFDSRRLTTFLSSAAQVMVVLLEEDLAERKSLKKLGTQTDMLSFSEGSLQLNTGLPFLNGRTISMLQFSQVQRYTVMSVHAPTTKPSTEHFDSSTIICIWNIWEPSSPQKILVYGSEIQCCCFSTGKAILVFAGTSVGSVVLWDLREPASNHYRTKIGEDEWAFRQPTFSTDAVMVDSGHLSAVTSVEIVSSTVTGDLRPELPLLAPEEDMSGLSFQLASLDERGILNFWVVVELPKGNEAGSPTDLGLRPGSKVKLLHSSSLTTVNRLSPRDAVKTEPSQTGHLKFLPSDSNHFFIGTNMGLVNHGTSHGLKAPPKFYRFQEPGVRPVDVTSIHFSPFKQNMFLVGCDDGSIRLHVVSHEQPVAEWKYSTAEQPIVSLQWSQTRPTVFCVLDAASNLYIWDLLKNETEPVVTEKMTSDRVTAMAVFGDSGQQNMYSGVALAHHSGKIEIQNFMRDFTVPITGEEEKLDNMMTEAF